jgi:hypothetical protein
MESGELKMENEGKDNEHNLLIMNNLRLNHFAAAAFCAALLTACIKMPDPVKALDMQLSAESTKPNTLTVKVSVATDAYENMTVSELGAEVSIAGNSPTVYKSANLREMSRVLVASTVYNVERSYTVQAYAVMGGTTYRSAPQEVAMLTSPCPTFSTGAIETDGQWLVKGETPVAIGSKSNATCSDGKVSYQWYKNDALIPAATAAAYTPPPADATQAGNVVYTRRAKDDACNTTFALSQGKWEMVVTATPLTPVFSGMRHLADQRTAYSLTLEATISDDNGYEVTERGFCWSATTYLPTLSDEKVTATDGGTGTYRLTIYGLQPNTCYYVTAYAKTMAGVVFWGGGTCYRTGEE